MSDRDTVILPVKISEQDRNALKELAEAQDTTASEIVRGLLVEYMQSKSTTNPFTGKLKPKGGKRPGAGRKRRAS